MSFLFKVPCLRASGQRIFHDVTFILVQLFKCFICLLNKHTFLIFSVLLLYTGRIFSNPWMGHSTIGSQWNILYFSDSINWIQNPFSDWWPQLAPGYRIQVYLLPYCQNTSLSTLKVQQFLTSKHLTQLTRSCHISREISWALNHGPSSACD